MAAVAQKEKCFSYPFLFTQYFLVRGGVDELFVGGVEIAAHVFARGKR